MLTAFHDEDYKLTAFGELADGYLEKPFSLSLLKVRIEAIFKKAPAFPGLHLWRGTGGF